MDKAQEELTFRIVFGALWLLHFAVRLYFQKKAIRKVEYTRVNAKQEKIYFSLYAVAYLLWPLYFLLPWEYARFPLPSVLRWTGAGVALVGIGLFTWSHQALGKNWTAVLALSPDQELVTDGPYCYIRHPMYTAFYLIALGFLALSANWLLGGIYLGTLLLMYAKRVAAEEKMMGGRFGNAYQEYMSKTGRLLPRF